MKAMRTSVRRTTASSQTTTGTTRTTSSSQCTTSTPMTTLTSTIAWCTSCVESAHRAHCSTLDDDTAHLMAQVLSPFIVIHGHTHGAFSLTRYSPFFLYLSFLPFSVFFLYHELFLELDNPIVMASLRYSAADESEEGHPELLHLSHTERVMWKDATLQPAKLRSSWWYGFWLVRSQTNNAHLIGTRGHRCGSHDLTSADVRTRSGGGHEEHTRGRTTSWCVS